MNKIYTVVIIGAGNIGALKPDNIDSPKTKNILTHAHAVKNNKRLRLVGIIDSNLVRRVNAGIKWRCNMYENIYEFIIAFNPSIQFPKDVGIVVIGTPTETHYEMLKEISEWFRPKLIICEKPFCNFLSEANQFKKIKIPIAVHYNRRFSNPIRKIQSELSAGEYGKIFSARIVYTRGLIRDASHAIDICNFFFGKFESGKILGFEKNAIQDYSEDDLTYPVYLTYQKCKHVFLMPSDGRAYSVFDMEIYTEKGKIELVNHFDTIRFFPHEKERIYGNLQSLSYKPKWIQKCDLQRSLVELYRNGVAFLDGNEALISTKENATEVHNVLHQIILP